MTRDPYRYTEVPVSKSQEGIRKMLLENGAVGIQMTEFPEEQLVQIQWARKVIVDKTPLVQPLRLKISTKGRRPEQCFRALFYHLKAKFEIVRFGIVTFEEEFLPYFLIKDAQGRPVTIAEYCLPELRRGLPPHLEPMRALGEGQP
jgi:hypothetical protein